MEKYQFEFKLLPGSDGKSNIFSITSITTEDNKVFAIPEELQAVGHHKEIIKTFIYAKVKNSLKKRYQTRKVWITMTEELTNIYNDGDGNLQFGDQYLEELVEGNSAQKTETNTLEQLFEKFVEITQENKQQSLKQIADKFIIEKFTSKNSNAKLWIDMFEKECLRLEVTKDEKKIEVLRLFMDKSCADWYSSMIMKLTLNSEWCTWKNKFCETFANKGCNPVSYALLFKYKEGSLLDYAIKKEKLLLDMRTSIDTGTLIDLIASGLPEFILNRIDREILKETTYLFNEVSKYEHMVNKKSFIVRRGYINQKTYSSNVSLINAKLLRLKGKGNNLNKADLVTINGVKKASGLTNLKIKIFEIEKEVDVYIIDDQNFKYEFLIGLDLIKTFKLIQTEDLKIIQKERKKYQIEEKAKSSEITYTLRNNEENKEILKECKVNFNEHIKEEDFKIKINHLDEKEKYEINKLVRKYGSIFAKDKYDVGTVHGYEARIDLLVEKYCSKRPYRCTMEDKKEIEQQIAKLLESGLIEESYSPFAAPVTLAYKKEENKKSRLCIDFRELNKILVPQAQPFPLIEDLVAKTRNCKYFTTLDINSAFWSIPMRIEDRKKTGFVTQEGHFQWTCLPFGLKTSPAIFQRILSNILRKYKLTDFAVNYIDDILIFSNTFDEHINHLTQLLEAIKLEGFRLKFTKCTFASDSVKYLGHITQNNTVKPLKDNLVSIRNFPTPKTQKNVRQFLGKINFYHEYIPRSAIILDPLHNLLRKNQKFVWTEECQKSFDMIKNLLCSQPVLEIFDQNLTINIYTDASIEGVGAILKQIQPDGKEKPVAYFSKKLNEAQKKKKAIYLECLAIKEAVRYWQYWLIGKSFTVYSDHKPLENMNLKSRTDEELGDLSYYLSQYEFKIKYAPGRKNIEADCLSRNPVLEPDDNTDEQLKIVNFIDMKDIIKDQEKNIRTQNNKNNLIEKQNILFKNIGGKEKIIISEEFSSNFFKTIHENMCHIGIRQMQKMVSPYYSARNLTTNIRKICRNCEVCIKNKSRGYDKF
ncbi:unnamed protein product [Arctia plantaginis]|uniref:RNA-directed DNA polymerase n=1 Tax=Arctia plantaginis TaxID=874455 RepID=A0A8S1AFN6_ARCPL|nr:unnamed protein product [Arctia plantaginis]